MRLEAQPITRDEALAFIAQHHRTHGRPLGYLFAIATNDGERVRGVIIVGRPLARMLQDGWTAEVLPDGTIGGCVSTGPDDPTKPPDNLVSPIWRDYLIASARERFARLWDEINGKRAPWASNPWVWVVSFRKI